MRQVISKQLTLCSLQSSSSGNLGPVSWLCYYSVIGKPTNCANRIEQNIVIMAACVPTMRPFFHRTWKRETTSGNAKSGPRSTDQLTGISLGRSNAGHKRVGSTMDVGLDDLDKDGAESSNSQQGIMRTIKVSMEWQRSNCAEETSRRVNGTVSQLPSKTEPSDQK